MNFHIKTFFNQFFDFNDRLDFGKMSFRLYNPDKDIIIDNFSKDDWTNIFSDLNEDDLKDLQTCSNVEILIWIDNSTGNEKGMIYLEEKIENPYTLEFHGGTWDHSPSFYRHIFISLIKLFELILLADFDITTTCRITDLRIEKFQYQFGFREYNRKNGLILKKLDKDKFFNSKLQNLIKNA